jgi:hypothetical protein
MSLKNRLELIIRGWFPTEPKVAKAKLEVAETVVKPKPWWWKPYWIVLVIASTIVNIMVIPSLVNISLENVAIDLTASLVCIGFAYYIRVRPSINMNRAIYVVCGAAGIGFLLWGVTMALLNAGGVLRLMRGSTGELTDIMIGSLFVGSYIAGAFISDWIGKKLNYRILLTP